MIILVLEYLITDREGRVLGNSKFQGPMRVKLGAGEVWPELEEKIKDMQVDEEKEFWIKVPYDRKKIKRVPRSYIPSQLLEGEEFTFRTPAGQWNARLLKYEGEEALIDLNPPGAGEEIHYKVRVIYREEI